MPLAAILAASVQSSPAAAVDAKQSLPATGAVLPAGRYSVDRDLVVTGDVVLMPGARIEIAAGRTLTFAGDFQAPASHVFVGTGRVDLNRGRALTARPEWWGAVAGDRGIDCLPALQAAIAAHPAVALGAGDYHVSNTVRITLPNRSIVGMTGFADGRTFISRLVLTKASGDVMQVGPDRDPGGPAAFLPGIMLRLIEFSRSVAVAATGSVERGGPAGLRVQYVTACQFDNLTSMEHATGYVLRATVRSFLRNCSAYRSRRGEAGAGDVFVGFLFDGSADFGMAGGNASLYATECVASTGGGVVLERSIGAYLPGAFADIFLIRFEMASMTHGIVVDGLSQAPDSRRTRYGNGDLHIVMPVLDAVSRVGLVLARLASYALVEVIDPYVAPLPGSLAAIHIHDGGGLLTISGGQLIGWVDADGGGDAVGIHVVNSSGLAVSGTKVLGFRRPVGLTGCRNFDIDVAISNPAQRASQGAVQLAACDRGSVKARVIGAANAFPAGVRLDGQANSHIAIDVTGVDPAAIVGGAVNKLMLDTRPITVSGPFGSHVASGVMQ